MNKKERNITFGKKKELGKKQIQSLKKTLGKYYPSDFSKFVLDQQLFQTHIKIKKLSNARIIITTTNNPLLFELEEKFVPTLHILQKFSILLATITVDIGAVKYMINGADLFRPGIIKWDSFKKNDIVTIINEKGTPLSIGITLMDGTILPEKGKITQTIHHLQDEIWNFSLI